MGHSLFIALSACHAGRYDPSQGRDGEALGMTVTSLFANRNLPPRLRGGIRALLTGAEISGEREVGRCGLGAGAQRPALNAIALWPPPTLCESLLPVSRGATHGSRILVSGGERTASRVRARCPGPTH